MKPKAYEPQNGYKYQILTKYNRQAWEHCDYATDRQELAYLLSEYKMAYGNDFRFRTIILPFTCWPTVRTK